MCVVSFSSIARAEKCSHLSHTLKLNNIYSFIEETQWKHSGLVSLLQRSNLGIDPKPNQSVTYW